jgi:hypothetical protein
MIGTVGAAPALSRIYNTVMHFLTLYYLTC